MSYKFQKATIAEIFEVYRSIPEFRQFKSLGELKKRLNSKPHLILIARCKTELVGFRAGYARSSIEFYSWLGAIHPKHRGRGIEAKLLSAQEHWARTQGYERITLSSRNRYPEMMRLLLTQQYRIYDYHPRKTLDEGKVYFVKPLSGKGPENAEKI